MPFIDPPLARRLELAHAWRGVNYAQARQKLHPESPIQVAPVGSGYAIFTGDASPMNRAVGLGMGIPVNPDDLEFIERFYGDRGIPVRVDLCPLADGSLQHALKQGGYRLEMFYNVLVCALSETILPETWPGKLRISQASDQEADLWIQTTAQGFGEAEAPPQEMLYMLAPNFYSAETACFLAWLDDQPAGGGAMYIHEGVAEFGGASTRPELRRHGVQTALLVARLQAARQQGCDLAVVVVSPGHESQRNAERVGFRMAYIKVICINI
jgi:GNAT superfamily N-acetyltransferase